MARVMRGGAREILALNCGSSSLKFGLYKASENSAELILEGEAEEIGSGKASFWFEQDGKRVEDEMPKALQDHAAALRHAFQVLNSCGAPQPEAVGHRFVHGGPELREHQLLTPQVARKLEGAAAFAPLHVPAALAVLHAAEEQLPGVPQAICFDTAFHRGMPEVSRTYALPSEVRELGVQRYGFHGLSLESIMAQLQPPPERLVVAHLGNGSSITAIRDGRSIDTTMGMTPTGGVMMGTRCGDLDPGVVIYLLRHGYATADRLEKLFDHQSGLLAVSKIGSDVRELVKSRNNSHDSDLALSMFCYQVRKAVAGMAAALGGLDGLVFTGGIGEHAADLRDEICSGLEFCGAGKDSAKVRVLPSQEDVQIAKNTAKLIQSN